jgi:hypothetical protein
MPTWAAGFLQSLAAQGWTSHRTSARHARGFCPHARTHARALCRYRRRSHPILHACSSPSQPTVDHVSVKVGPCMDQHQRGYGATAARLTPDQKVGSSNLSGLISFSKACASLTERAPSAALEGLLRSPAAARALFRACALILPGAHGVVVSHPLRMRKALGSNPSVSILCHSRSGQRRK